MAKAEIRAAIRLARKQNALSQAELAGKVGATQATISNWETGKQEPDPTTLKKLQEILGADFFTEGKAGQSDASSVLAEWLSKTRQQAAMTVAQLAKKSGLSVPTIYNIEAGRAENPRRRTIERLEKAVGKTFEKEFEDELRQASTIEGVGEFQDFDPHDEEDWPSEGGVYVFYDISERPIYVGMAGDISRPNERAQR